MGLDNYWVKKDQSEPFEIGRDFGLCGGIMSGHGDGSFRGKVYDQLIEHVTGVSLYTARIPSEKVKEMAQKLEATEYDSNWENEFGVGETEWGGLVQMFLAYANVDGELIAWW